jgi:hypothetical protein
MAPSYERRATDDIRRIPGEALVCALRDVM